jgi:hypothetical protein
VDGNGTMASPIAACFAIGFSLAYCSSSLLILGDATLRWRGGSLGPIAGYPGASILTPGAILCISRSCGAGACASSGVYPNHLWLGPGGYTPGASVVADNGVLAGSPNVTLNVLRQLPILADGSSSASATASVSASISVTATTTSSVSSTVTVTRTLTPSVSPTISGSPRPQCTPSNYMILNDTALVGAYTACAIYIS